MLATYNTRDQTPVCDQLGGVRTGDRVAVRDPKDQVVGSGQLGSPQSSTRPADQRNLTTQLSCSWPFTTSPVPDRTSYQVQVANQPARAYTRADLANQQWTITIEEERNITGG